MPVGVSAAPLSIQFSVNVPGEQAEDGPSIWAPVTHMGDLDGGLGSWFSCGPVLVVETIFQSEPVNGECFSFSFSLPLSLSQLAFQINQSFSLALSGALAGGWIESVSVRT